MPHVYVTLKHSHPQNNRNDTRLVSQCPMFMGLANTRTLRTIEMTPRLVSQCPMFMGLSNIHTLRTIEMTPRLVSPNAPCLWDSQTLTPSEQ